MEITILVSNPDHPIIDTLKGWIKKHVAEGHEIDLVFNKDKLKGGDILFLVSCDFLIGKAEKKLYRACLVLHASDLPKGRGWSPHIWSILNGVDQIVVCLLEASDPVDSGAIWLKKVFKLKGHELLPEINRMLFESEFSLMSEAINHFDSIKPQEQKGDSGPYMRRRIPADSRLDPSKPIAEQFNTLRVVDANRFPAFFDYLGYRYILKIEKVVNDNET